MREDSSMEFYKIQFQRIKQFHESNASEVIIMPVLLHLEDLSYDNQLIFFNYPEVYILKCLQ